MRGLTSRGVRPCLRHGNTSITSSTPPVRRTILPPTRKGLTPADAFAILLPGVLTAALVADLTAKKDRIHEWDRQIAVVEAEAAQLRERQAESWCRIQQRSVARGLWQQRRMITTSTARAFEVSEEIDPLVKEKEMNAGDLESPDPESEMVTTEEHVESQKRFERLVATRLALQFMLQLRAGRSQLYTPQVTIGPSNPKYSQSMDYLVRELEKIQQMMAAMRIEKVPWRLEMPLDFTERKRELGNRLDELTESYRRVEMHLPDFIMSYVQLIGEYKMGPPVLSYILMMRTLSQMQNGESPMAAMTENAVWDTHQLLSSHAIANIIYRHGSDGESVRFRELLSRLTDSDKWPKPHNSWFRATVNEMQIAIPKSRNPTLMVSLIRTALCNQQQTVAEAYGTVFFNRARVGNYTGFHKWHVVACFLESYGSWGTWSAARRWLQTAVQWAMDLLDAGEDVLGRVVLRMLNCCVACDRRDEYEQILEAAVTHHIKCPKLDETRFLKLSDRTRHVRLDWLARARAKRRPDEPLQRVVSTQDVAAFQAALQGRFDDQQKLPMKKPFHPSEAEWRGDKKPSAVYRPFLAAAEAAEANGQLQTNGTQGVGAAHAADESFHEKDPSMLTVSPFFSPAAEEHYSTRSQPATPGDTSEQQREIERLRKALADAEARLRAAEGQVPLQEQPQQAEIYVADEPARQAGTG
ncbi:hypothetical protein LTR70_001041 [Exophiala xenobiotica]|uniref:Uncharacterized protein n=1 Tax=Lithohypha guttulata TaxID=1690604 RepID=A0ABR0KMW0_9EURO|nr:hypothetical protein LTR24_000769 [Lithohypha guttulata]KAK5328887.1 hypothetical protein LTR70_001041 [Exophiala xenobiotica]